LNSGTCGDRTATPADRASLRKSSSSADNPQQRGDATASRGLTSLRHHALGVRFTCAS